MSSTYTADHRTAQLEADVLTVLGDAIGLYEYNGGTEKPAIAFDHNTANHHSRPKVTGLEVVIEPENGIEFESFIGGSSLTEEIMRITLKQWDSTKTAQQPTLLLMRRLSRIVLDGSYRRVPRIAALDNIDQASFLVQFGLVYL